MAKTSNEIVLKNYSKLLSEIKNFINLAKEKIAKISVRQKVEMSWQIGRLINENLLQDARASYGKYLIDQLEVDLQIKRSVLYKMQAFHKTYPKLPKDDERLNWSHYRTLAQIKDSNQRQYLENLVIENNWTSGELETAVKTNKNQQVAAIKNAKGAGQDTLENKGENENESEGKFTSANSSKNPAKKPTKLPPKRGQLYSYPLVNFKETNKFYLDLGFNIFREVEENLSKDLKTADAIAVKKLKKSGKKAQKQSTYLLSKLSQKSGKFNTYKAFVERVVDGDTIHFTVDLGFGILHKEIIRLRGINAAEIATSEGKKSAEFLNKLMKKIDFVVIKTTQVDIYGRYVADVFFNEKNLAENLKRDPQEIANEGVYLNQLLLDCGMAEMF